MDNCKKLLIKYPENSSDHPHCPHGPTLLFYYENTKADFHNGYFGCAAYRDKKLCNFHLTYKKFMCNGKRSNPGEYNSVLMELKKLHDKFNEALKNGIEVHFCHTCNIPLFGKNVDSEHVLHTISQNLSMQEINNPTHFFRPFNDEKSNAQYFFDKKALNFFINCLVDLNIKKVICMGAPRLHEHVRSLVSKHDIKSFLLDFDFRFYYFYDDSEFGWYNMCNNFFFDIWQEQGFHKFLKCNPGERVLLLTDPPFGCRTEPIANSITQIRTIFNTVNNLKNEPLPLFWIFPYFFETYIKKEMPELEMCDYKINYTNHLSYTDTGSKSRKLGSPVRVFTNVPLNLLRLPVKEEYKYCSHCSCYTALENRHCFKCGTCPSKNGSTYVHCKRCDTCVKPNYKHCVYCRRCVQVEGHNCEKYQDNQWCWICLRQGHIEYNCEVVSKMAFKPTDNAEEITCLLCAQIGHNERKCSYRSKYLDETSFMGETIVKINFK